MNKPILKPRPTDLVMGGSSPPPVNGAVLGGAAGTRTVLAGSKRRLISNNGAEVETPLSDEVALNICSTLESKFARELCAKAKLRALSESQLVWVHKLAIESLEKKLEVKIDIGGKVLVEIFRLLDVAGENLKMPAIRLADPAESGEIKLYKAGDRSKHPGSIQVKLDSLWVGRIEALPLVNSAQFIKAYKCPLWVEQMLLKFATDPIGVAKEYAKLTGRCCFCGRGLDDERSTAAGYGPVCAKHYGLPWREVK